MKERPILFSGAMVRALLSGEKTQTRRIIKRPRQVPEDYRFDPNGLIDPALGWWAEPNGLRCGYSMPCPYGLPGDRLYVRETLKRAPDLWTYAADGQEVGWPGRGDIAGTLRDTIVSIHMPRSVSRLVLEITEVRAERLHDITAEDAEREGVREPSLGEKLYVIDRGSPGTVARSRAPALVLWQFLWRSINGDASWDNNPWVWVVSFKVVDANTQTSRVAPLSASPQTSDDEPGIPPDTIKTLDHQQVKP